MLRKSRIWGKGKPHSKEGNRAIVEAAIVSASVGVILYCASTAVVQILVRPLDRRMNKIVVGISQLFSAVVFLMMSVHVPQWFGIYYSNKNTMVSYTSERGIRFYLSWNISKQLFSMFFFNLFFSCSDFNLAVVNGFIRKSFLLCDHIYFVSVGFEIHHVISNVVTGDAFFHSFLNQ